jgi:hypothetical protein
MSDPILNDQVEVPCYEDRMCDRLQARKVKQRHSMTFDHIQLRSKDGATSFENVCLACRTCNEYKSDSTEAEDSLTGEIVSAILGDFEWFGSPKIGG